MNHEEFCALLAKGSGVSTETAERAEAYLRRAFKPSPADKAAIATSETAFPIRNAGLWSPIPWPMKFLAHKPWRWRGVRERRTSRP